MESLDQNSVMVSTRDQVMVDLEYAESFFDLQLKEGL